MSGPSRRERGVTGRGGVDRGAATEGGTDPAVQIAADRCVGCGDCVDRCPTGAITHPAEGQVVVAENLLCIGCRRCVDVCPSRAIAVTGPKQPVTAALDRLRSLGGPPGADGSAGSDPAGSPSSLGRRRFLTGAGLLGGGVVAGTALGATGLGGGRAGAAGLTGTAGTGSAAGGRLPAVPFHGTHQAGILTPAPPVALFAVFDLTAADRAEVVELMRALTDLARRLTAGAALPDAGITAPPADNALLGADPVADGLTLTVGLGASAFDDRFGLAGRIPKRLTAMHAFAGDALDPTRIHGDLLVQLRAGHRDSVLRALRLIARAVRGGLQLRYRLEGFLPPPAPSGAPRDLLGFKHGIANPPVGDPAVARRLLWAAGDEPAWAAGGTYQVLRAIRTYVESWDRLPLAEQEAVIGRRRDTGAPLDGQVETDLPRYAYDPQGAVIPLTAHIRRAGPGTADVADSRLLRADYHYDRGLADDGGLDVGLLLSAYQQDPRRQFEAIQARLADMPLAQYVAPVAGGYFFVLPGVRDDGDHYARGLLA